MFDTCPNLNATIKPCNSYVKGGFCSRDDTFRCMEYMKSSGQVGLSFSSIKDYTSCHRKFWHGWIQGIKLKEIPFAIRMGQRASIILGWLHNAKLPIDEAIIKYREYISSEIEESCDPQDQNDVGSLSIWAMKAMFDAYIELDFHTLRGIPEYEFRWNIPEYPALHGFIDLAVLDEHRGEEFKWTSSPEYYGKFNMNDQLSSYFIGAPSLQSFRVRCFVPPVLKFKKGEKISELYERGREGVKKSPLEHFMSNIYYRNEFDLDSYKKLAKMVTREIIRYLKDAEMTGDPMYHFYQSKQACWSPRCSFQEICFNGIMPENLYEKREKR